MGVGDQSSKLIAQWKKCTSGISARRVVRFVGGGLYWVLRNLLAWLNWVQLHSGASSSSWFAHFLSFFLLVGQKNVEESVLHLFALRWEKDSATGGVDCMRECQR